MQDVHHLQQEILHELLHRNPRNHGSIVYMGLAEFILSTIGPQFPAAGLLLKYCFGIYSRCRILMPYASYSRSMGP